MPVEPPRYTTGCVLLKQPDKQKLPNVVVYRSDQQETRLDADADVNRPISNDMSALRPEFVELLSRCTQFPESRLFVFNPSPGFNCIVTALKSRTLALKTRTKFLPKFVRDISTKMTPSFLPALVSVRDLSTSSSVNSGI